MNLLDVVILVIVGFCLVRGIFRGIIQEATSIAGVFVGFYGAYTFYPLVARLMPGVFADKAYLHIVSFLIAFTVLFVAIGLIGILLKLLLKAISLGWTDRVLGAVFGLVKAVLIASVLLVPLTTFLPKKSPLLKESVLTPYVSRISQAIVLVVPKEMKKQFGDNIEALKEALKEL